MLKYIYIVNVIFSWLVCYWTFQLIHPYSINVDNKVILQYMAVLVCWRYSEIAHHFEFKCAIST